MDRKNGWIIFSERKRGELNVARLLKRSGHSQWMACTVQAIIMVWCGIGCPSASSVSVYHTSSFRTVPHVPSMVVRWLLHIFSVKAVNLLSCLLHKAPLAP